VIRLTPDSTILVAADVSPLKLHVMEDGMPENDQEKTNRPLCLPRLPKEYYQRDALVHWTLTIDERKTGWLNDTFHQPRNGSSFHRKERRDRKTR